jgi:predicted GNAT family acetyltransferase
VEVRHNTKASRYELWDGDAMVGIADYRLSGDTVVFPHTEIVWQRRGEGLGATLVRGALDDVRSLGKRVVAQCWYVAEFIDDNPEYRDLTAA